MWEAIYEQIEQWSSGLMDELLNQKPAHMRDLHKDRATDLQGEDLLTLSRPEDSIFRDSVTGESSLEDLGEVANVDLRGVSEVRGLRNNNPLNIEQGEDWQGLAGEQLDTRFATFEDAEHGLRAGAKVLKTYQDKHGLKTVRDMIKRWAPEHENPTDAYVNNVASAVGVGADDEISIGNNEQTKNMLMAMVNQENGEQPFDSEVFDRALGLAF